MLKRITDTISRLLNRHVERDGDESDFAAFNVQAVPASPVDALTLDKLNTIVSTAHAGNADDLFALYSDIVSRDATFIAGALQRKAPLVARPGGVSAPDKSDTALRIRRDMLRAQWAACRGKRQAIAHLLDASAWPMAYVRKVWREAKPGAVHFYDLAELRPVPFWQVTFAANEHGPAGSPKIKKLSADGSWDGSSTEPPDPLHFICHRGHLLQANPDCWGGPMRAVVFWWYFAAWARQAMANHLEGHNQPKWVAKYPRNEADKAKAELLRAFRRSTVTTALVVPEDAKIEAIQTLKSDTSTAFSEFIALCQREIAKVIVAQTLTLEAQPQGLGSQQSQVHGDQLSGIQEFDAALLGETLEEQVLRAWLDLNGMAGGPCPSFTWGADDGDAAVKADMLNDLKLAGIRVKEEGMEKLSTIIGLPLERVPEATGLAAFSAERPAPPAYADLDRLAERTAADLAEAFGVEFAGFSRAIREAKDADDLDRRLRPLVATLAPRRAAKVVEEAVAAAAANGFLAAAG